MKIEGLISRFSRGGNQSQQQIRLTGMGSLAVTQVEGPRTERLRAARRFGGGTQIIANGIAPVAAIPTVTATLALYNAEADGGKSYLIDHLHVWLGSGTPAAGLTVLATVSPGKIASPPAGMATGFGAASLSGSGVGTKARWATAVTLPGTPAWVALMSSLQLAAANAGEGDQPYQADGGLLVPPGYALGLAILSGAGTTPLYGVSCIWDEMELDLE